MWWRGGDGSGGGGGDGEGEGGSDNVSIWRYLMHIA